MNTVRVGFLNHDALLSQNDAPVLLVFGGVWDSKSDCWYSNLKIVAEKFDGKIITGIVDIDYAIDLFSIHNVSTLPTMIFFDDGKEIMRCEEFHGTYDVINFVHKFFGAEPYFVF